MARVVLVAHLPDVIPAVKSGVVSRFGELAPATMQWHGIQASERCSVLAEPSLAGTIAVGYGVTRSLCRGSTGHDIMLSTSQAPLFPSHLYCRHTQPTHMSFMRLRRRAISCGFSPPCGISSSSSRRPIVAKGRRCRALPSTRDGPNAVVASTDQHYTCEGTAGSPICVMPLPRVTLLCCCATHCANQG